MDFFDYMSYLNPNNAGIRRRRGGLEVVEGGVEAVGRHSWSGGSTKRPGFDKAERGSRIAAAAIQGQGAELFISL